MEWHMEYTHNGTTWNKAARQANQKYKLCTITTLKVMAPHPEQAPSLLNQVTDKSLPPDDAMIIDEPASDAAGPSTQPMASVNNMAVLPYDDDELDLLLW